MNAGKPAFVGDANARTLQTRPRTGKRRGGIAIRSNANKNGRDKLKVKVKDSLSLAPTLAVRQERGGERSAVPFHFQASKLVSPHCACAAPYKVARQSGSGSRSALEILN